MSFAPLLGEEFELVVLANGVRSLRSTSNGQTFHPVVGPAAEAQAVHLAGTRLAERAPVCPDGSFTIWDVGLGAAANATAAIGCLLGGSYRGAAQIHLLSFDRTLGALDFALAHADALQYPAPYLPFLRTLRKDGQAVVELAGAELHWRLVLADFPAWLASSAPSAAPDAIFYDPYSPTVNREMWTLEVFSFLRARLHAGRPCLLTTYTRSTAVRVTLLLAGFHVGLGRATGEKDETTIATNDPGLLPRPLTSTWLEKKVYASTNAAPLRSSAPTLGQSPIAEADYARLQAHPQFA